MNTEIQELRTALAAERERHIAYRTSVRDEILEQHFNGTWCLPGTQDALVDLDLSPVAMHYTGEATITVSISQVKGATSRDEAYARVKAALDAVNNDAGITMTVHSVNASVYEDRYDDRPTNTTATARPNSESPF
ncbi:hypothetical protein [Amycolatopsis sp. lyj-112]|uniref:hypothetical protein n=1 Tax=Amycolatopsis sp. lyj-112 TaxID=2789288 RepID=UPI00397DB3DA